VARKEVHEEVMDSNWKPEFSWSKGEDGSRRELYTHNTYTLFLPNFVISMDGQSYEGIWHVVNTMPSSSPCIRAVGFQFRVLQ
jgi:hypothetical protein